MRGISAPRCKQWVQGEIMDKIIRAHGDTAALLAMYVQTSPLSHMSGIYYLPLYQISLDLKRDVKEIKPLIQKLEESGFIKYDQDYQIVWVIPMARDQVGDGHDLKIRDNRVKSVIAHVTEYLPDSPLCGEFLAHYGLNGSTKSVQSIQEFAKKGGSHG